jgi:hypothetical protein
VDNTQAQVAIITLGVAFLLMVSSLCLFTSNDKKSSGVVSMIAFVTQAVGFGIAVAGFASITATSLTTDQEWTYWVPYFGPGLYLSGIALVLVLTCSLLALTAPKRSVPKKDLLLEMDSI